MTQNQIPEISSDQHTPGPWDIAPFTAPYIADSRDAAVKAWLVETGADKFEAISVGTKTGSVAIIPLDESNEANARLIAAAPDLLEALQDLFGADMEHVLMGDGKDDQIEAIQKAHAAIAKATGQGVAA